MDKNQAFEFVASTMAYSAYEFDQNASKLPRLEEGTHEAIGKIIECCKTLGILDRFLADCMMLEVKQKYLRSAKKNAWGEYREV
jgi:hypothetical protein